MELFLFLFLIFQQPYEESRVCPILQMKKLRAKPSLNYMLISSHGHQIWAQNSRLTPAPGSFNKQLARNSPESTVRPK